MICVRATLALLAVVCAALASTGCCSRAYQGPRPVLALAAPRDRNQNARPVETFTIVFSTFIPSNYVLGPGLHPQSFCGLVPPKRLAFAGDDRGFDVDSTCYRARQVVTIIPEEDDDPDGLLEGAKQNLGGLSESFVASQALADGRIDDRDRDGVLGDGEFKQGESAAVADGMLIDDPVRLGPHTVYVRLRTARTGGPRNRLVIGAPSIDWDFGITIDTSGPEPTYEVVGAWDGYPAAELYINRQPVFRSTPGNRPGSFVDLLKLLPGYADTRFVTRGTLNGKRGARIW
ncbi:hypothetical protein V5E97_02910 [Singulisphaera sp. Ch08]|uniref:Uncharacterized protein n=1 Tax=Singulisphaera sp. Ch08 TaxID=3120278 RepID=A0AAU7CHP8_9BACT